MTDRVEAVFRDIRDSDQEVSDETIETEKESSVISKADRTPFIEREPELSPEERREQARRRKENEARRKKERKQVIFLLSLIFVLLIITGIMFYTPQL